MSDLVIYALRVNGGILALCQMPGLNGHYADDLDHLRDWKPALAITMTTEMELMQHGAATLGADFQAMGTRWVHLPVDDFGVPDARISQAWKAVSPQVMSALKGGGRVLVHCKGGCGRSGMIVLRLMVDAGEEPLEALRRLRAVRPCAVETEAQWVWAGQRQEAPDTGADTVQDVT